MGVLTWNLYVWRFEGQSLMHHGFNNVVLIGLSYSFEWELTQITQVLEWPTSQPAKNGPTSSFISFPLLHARMGSSFRFILSFFQSLHACFFFFFFKSIFRIWPSMNHSKRARVLIYLFLHSCFQKLVSKSPTFK